MNISFPRLDSLDSAKSANYRKAEKMTKKVLLAEIQRQQISLDSLHGKIAKFETVQDSKSLEDWTQVVNKAKALANEEIKKGTKATWRDLKTVFSELSFKISQARKNSESVSLPLF